MFNSEIPHQRNIPLISGPSIFYETDGHVQKSAIVLRDALPYSLQACLIILLSESPRPTILSIVNE